ncbi:hypothetical protein CALVIDRAFT_542710 [Calocera viscosa TUFC12733]|uniref:Cytokinin riboside 5'-monophosphate phosphoribohydrolase n=1 Tax=Calocera viscosa (strain TUFC12733) TaxID=1330018 RepID=A0A167GBL7_CALVF|nr:hypothetical protein CALVIDRAFT_542710 [Calocera viscosa TUFC12733]
MSKPAVCVFCASSIGTRPAYLAAASSVGKAIAASGRKLVYGGGMKGLMGATAHACVEAGGQVVGVIPYAMVASGGEGYGTIPGWEGNGMEVVVAKSMHERKQTMAARAEAGFIALPGGFGTFEEVLEMITWTQLGIHQKPVILLNIFNFYSPLRQMIRDAVDSGFIPPNNIRLAVFVDCPEGIDPGDFDWGNAALDALEDWKHVKGPRNFDWTLQQKAEAVGEKLEG